MAGHLTGRPSGNRLCTWCNNVSLITICTCEAYCGQGWCPVDVAPKETDPNTTLEEDTV